MQGCKKLKDTKYILGTNQIPVVTEKSVGYIEANVINEIDCNTHILFVLEMNGSVFFYKVRL